VDYFFGFVTPKETEKISKCFLKSLLGASTILGNNNLPTSTFHIKETQFCFVALYLLLRYLFSLMVKFSQNVGVGGDNRKKENSEWFKRNEYIFTQSCTRRNLII
jgi:hypothetical protein